MPNMNTTKAQRKQYTPEFKAQMVRQILKEERSVSQLAAEFEVNPGQLYKWRDIALQELPSLFMESKGNVQPSDATKHEEQMQVLYAEIGRLSTELTLLKRKVGYLDQPQ